MKRSAFLILLAAAGPLASCSEPAGPEPVVAVTFVSASLTLPSGAQQTVSAITEGKGGKLLEGRRITWSSADSTVARVDSTGKVTARFITTPANRETTITATSGAQSGTFNVVVEPSIAASVDLGTDALSLAHGAVQPLTATIRDAANNVLTGRVIEFSSRDTTIALVSTNGIISTGAFLGVSSRDTRIVASVGLVRDSVVVTVAPTTVASVIVTPTNPFLKVARTRRLRATPLSPAGIVIPGATVSWFTSDANIATVSSSGLVSGIALGDASIAAVAGGLTGNAAITVNQCGNAPVGDYPIEVRFTAGTPSVAVAQAFSCAAARMMAVIRDPLSPVLYTNLNAGACATGVTLDETVTGLLIFATVEPIDGPGKILGSAGPCYLRADGNLPNVGRMRFDVADLENMITNGTLGVVIMHEMLHVIGVGTIWSNKGLLNGVGSNPRFLGPLARVACIDDHLGIAFCSEGVHVEDCIGITGCGAGTINAHWRESSFDTELMTGYIDGAASPFSRMTIQSLADLGYGVDPLQSDDYALTPPPWVMLRTAPGDVIKMPAPMMPIGRVDRWGRVTPIPR